MTCDTSSPSVGSVASTLFRFVCDLIPGDDLDAVRLTQSRTRPDRWSLWCEWVERYPAFASLWSRLRDSTDDRDWRLRLLEWTHAHCGDVSRLLRVWLSSESDDKVSDDKADKADDKADKDEKVGCSQCETR